MKATRFDRTIKKIEIFNLFGYYNYCIDHSGSAKNSNPLLIIYGDNGSGKTTLLKMIFYLLSPIDKGGHKTKLCAIKFNKFCITLSDDTIVSASRKDDEVSGAYALSIVKNAQTVSRVLMEPDSDNIINVSISPKTEKLYYKFLDCIRNFHISVNFLSDNRELFSFEETPKHRTVKRSHSIKSLERFAFIGEEEPEDELDVSIKKLENWLRSNVLKGAKAGEENANTIYTKLIRQISTPRINSISSKQVKVLLEKIKTLKKESLAFYESGLVSEIEIEGFENALMLATDSNIILIYNILEPYIEGIKGRLSSLSEVQSLLTLFLNNINDYFSNKVISYNIDTGFKLSYKHLDEPIDFRTLSSGEKQLLHLFCSVITASSDSTVFIIDEPEISLNVKWQRKLINTLLSFAFDKKVQFIFASHSIELLSGHKNSVYKLESQNNL